MLREVLIDFIIQVGLPHTTIHSRKFFVAPTSFVSVQVGSELASINSSTPTSNRTIQKWKDWVQFFVGSSTRVLIPICKSNHFNILSIVINIASDSFYKSVVCYDSLYSPPRQSQTRITLSHPSLRPIDQRFHTFVLMDETEERLLKAIDPAMILEYKPCPKQSNAIDCGLFTAGVVLRLFKYVTVSESSFSQDGISLLTCDLAYVGLIQNTTRQ